MRRLLLVTAAAGGLVVAVGSTGVLAVFTDTATTGVETKESLSTGAIEVEAGEGIAIAHYPRDPACGTFRDDLQLPVYEVADVQPGDDHLGGPLFSGLCVRNDGDEPVTILMSAVDVTATETGCSAEEGAVDPQGPTCGDLGEADEHVRWRAIEAFACPQNPEPDDFFSYSSLSESAAVLTLAPDEVGCLVIDLAYLPPTEADGVEAQTEIVRWRYQLDADVVT